MIRTIILSTCALPVLLTLALPMEASAAPRTFTITSFDSIRVDAPVRVTVATGGGTSAQADGDRKMLDRLSLAVSGGLLIVRLAAPLDGDKSGSGILTVRLTTQALRRAWLTGGGALAIDGMHGQRGQIALSGGGTLSVGALAVDQLNADLSGGGRMTLAGTAGDATLSVSGSGMLAAEGLKARNAKLWNNGSGNLIATVVTSADIRASGSGDVTALGKPACKVAHSGSGSVSCGGEEH